MRKGQAIPAESPLVPNTTGFDPDFRSEGYDPKKARALLDTYGYVDRDGDGWREQPDGSPLLITDLHAARPSVAAAQRTAAQGLRGDRHQRQSSRQAKWPENLRNVRAGNFMVWGVGSSAASPDGQPALDRDRFASTRAGRISRASATSRSTSTTTASA